MSDVQFWRSNKLSDTSFIDLVKRTFGKTFTKGIDAKNWLITNGYYTSYPDIVTDGLVLYLDAANIDSFKGEPTTNYAISFGPWTVGGVNTEITGIGGVPVPDARTWKFEKTGTSNQWNGWESNYGGTWTGNAGDVWTTSYWYKTTQPAGITNFTVGNFVLSDWSRSYNITILSNVDTIIPDGKWHYNYTTTRIDENYSNAIIADGPSWSYSTSSGILYINGVQWEKKSYATPFVNGTRGTTYVTNGGWCDLSGNANHGILVDSVTNNGNLTLTGTGHIEISNSSSLQFTTAFTQIAWFRLLTPFSDSYHTLFGKPNYGKYGIIIEWNSDNVVLFDFIINGTRNNISLSQNNGGWNFVAQTYDSNVGTNNHKVYLYNSNGYYSSSATSTGTVETSTDTMIIGGNMNINIPIIKAYNRALSASEILQNFNAYKERFGL